MANWIGGLALVLSGPPVLLAVCAMTGLGLDQNLSSQMATLGALFVVVLPAVGLASALGGHAIAHALALVGISLAILVAFPSYFPERRQSATQAGLEYFSRPLGTARQARVVKFGLAMLETLGPEPIGTIRAQRSKATPGRVEETSPAETERGEVERQATWIPYQGDGETIVVPAHIDGPDFGEELRFIFDTGATLTTISKDVLELLDIEIPADAPEIRLHTAAGEMQAKLVLVDAIWLDEQVVEWITIAVCEHCSSGEADGLLGLNVSSHFRVSIDHDTRGIEFVPRPGRRNRRLDIQPWLEFNSVLRRWDDERVEITIDANNRAHRGIKSTVLEVKCSDEHFTIHLDPIAAKKSITQRASLPWGTRCETFELTPLAAAWETNRF